MLTAFADTPADFDMSRGRLLLQVRDELIEARLEQREGQLWITEGETRTAAVPWLATRVARLPLLADRLLSHVPATDFYVEPAATVLERPDAEASDALESVAQASSAIARIFDRRLLGATSVVYLTSDAGEGKTTLINKVARAQAARFKKRDSDWLLLPVALGGRGFQRFDDAVIATLVNRLRFQLLYFEGFLELVKLGYIVPAFDGFEEVFIENSSGEAISALSNLVSSLSSSGGALIAARKAYFEYQSFSTQAKLFDGMGGQAASFARVGLERWDRAKYVEYGRLRGVDNADEIYEAVAARFLPAHPLLTRAVLVKRFMDVATSVESTQELLTKLGSQPEDYFFLFVSAIVEREANLKWIDRSGESAGEPNRPLLSVEEHHELLALVAFEMWLAATEILKADVLDVVADMFADAASKGPVLARQVRERLKQHSLLVNADSSKTQFAFDHEDFRKFYLGEALGRAIARRDISDTRRALAVGAVPFSTAEATVSFLARSGIDDRGTVSFLDGLARRELSASFVKENCGLLILLLLASPSVAAPELVGYVFPSDALRARNLRSVVFTDCHFQATSLDKTTLEQCTFTRCQFDRVELSSTSSLVGSRVQSTTFGSLVNLSTDDHIYDPDEIARVLESAGLTRVSPARADLARNVDDDVRLVERALRNFLRATQLNEHVFHQRLAGKSSRFFSHILPKLMDASVLEEVQYRGAGNQRRFRLATPMLEVQAALSECDGTFENFLRILSTPSAASSSRSNSARR